MERKGDWKREGGGGGAEEKDRGRGVGQEREGDGEGRRGDDGEGWGRRGRKRKAGRWERGEIEEGRGDRGGEGRGEMRWEGVEERERGRERGVWPSSPTSDLHRIRWRDIAKHRATLGTQCCNTTVRDVVSIQFVSRQQMQLTSGYGTTLRPTKWLVGTDIPRYSVESLSC